MESLTNALYVITLIVLTFVCDPETAIKAFLILSVMLLVIRLGSGVALLRTITGNLVIMRRNYDPNLDRTERILSDSTEIADRMEDAYNEEK